MNHANFMYEKHPAEDGVVIIRDIGPWDQYPTITNDAENVVIAVLGHYPEKVRRILYYDSEGDLDELKFKDGRFIGFSPGLTLTGRL